MANPSSVGVIEPALIEATTTASSVTLDKSIQYEITHSGLNTSGASTTDAILLATQDSTAALTAGDGQAILTTAVSVKVGPGVDTLKFDATTNAPTFTVWPIASLRNF